MRRRSDLSQIVVSSASCRVSGLLMRLRAALAPSMRCYSSSTGRGTRIISSVLGGLLTRFVTRALIVVAATLGIVFVQIAPASATVHEIVGQWCSLGAPSNKVKEQLNPPGISGGSNADNFAKPLNASGFVTGNLVPFTGSAGPGLLVEFNYGIPNAKVIGTGDFIVIDTRASVPLYLELIEPDPDFAAFKALPEVGDRLTCRHRKSAERLNRLTGAPPRSVGLLHLS